MKSFSEGILIHPVSSPSQIVLVIVGCSELLMGFNLATEDLPTSLNIYVPFWQGVLVQNIWLLIMKIVSYLINCVFPDILCVSFKKHVHLSSKLQ